MSLNILVPVRPFPTNSWRALDLPDPLSNTQSSHSSDLQVHLISWTIIVLGDNMLISNPRALLITDKGQQHSESRKGVVCMCEHVRVCVCVCAPRMCVPMFQVTTNPYVC